MRLQKKSRRGTIVVLVAFALTALVGFVAIAAEGGLVQHNRRIAQAVADSAALAAANSLYANYVTYQGADGDGSAADRALAVANANGYTNDGVNSKVTVNIPPTSGIHQNEAGFAEVLVEFYQPRGFSVIWGRDRLTISARAVARGQWIAFNNGILVLDPTSPAALNNNGSGRIKVVDSNVIVNSNAPNAASATGGGTITAPEFDITGNPGTSTSGGGTFNGTIYSNQMPTPDPLAYLSPPDPSSLTLQSKNPTNYAGSKDVTIYPGVYQGGIHISGQVTLTMMPGIYYMDGGGFSFTGQGSLNATGVMIYTAPKSNSDVININGLGQINLTPMTTGVYRGISFWQQRSSTNTVYITGNGTSSLYGAIYAQHGLLTVSGNGAQDVLGSQYISYDVNLGGNGNFNVQWQPDITPRTRKLGLVE